MTSGPVWTFTTGGEAPGVSWAQSFSGNITDSASGVASDPAGNTYVAGRSNRGTSTGYDIRLTKYDPAGIQQWTRYFDGGGGNWVDDEGNGVAVDLAGDIYVAGASSPPTGGDYDCQLLKYDSGGNLLWNRRWDGVVHRDDHAYAVVADAEGNVYIAGKTWTGTEYALLVLSYDSGGGMRWSDQFGVGAEGNGIAVDPVGNVFVTGWASNGANRDWVTLKYSGAGQRLWAQAAMYDSGTGNDYAWAVSCDAAGNAYVAGQSQAANGWNSDWRLIKYGPGGQVLYNVGYDSGFDDALKCLAVSSSGEVFAAGRAQTTCSTCWVLAKFDGSGKEEWRSFYDVGGSQGSSPAGIGIDLSNELWLAGGYPSGTLLRLGAPAVPLTCAWGASPNPATLGQAVTFSPSYSGGTGPFTYDWDFGDGSPHDSSISPSHTYASSGVFTATMVISDSLGARCAFTSHIIVNQPASQPLTCSASALVFVGPAPLTTQLSVQASGGTPPYTFSWAFGDGQTDTAPTVVHTYSSPAAYTATCTVLDSASATSQCSVVVTVTSGSSCQAAGAALVTEAPTDGTTYPAGQAFTKTWTLKNSDGNCTWSSGYCLQYVSNTNGYLSTSQASVCVSASVAPGQDFAFQVPMQAPSEPGHYREYWKLTGPDGKTIPVSGSQTVWADINVGGLQTDFLDPAGDAAAAARYLDCSATPCKVKPAFADLMNMPDSLIRRGTVADGTSLLLIRARTVDPSAPVHFALQGSPEGQDGYLYGLTNQDGQGTLMVDAQPSQVPDSTGKYDAFALYRPPDHISPPTNDPSKEIHIAIGQGAATPLSRGFGLYKIPVVLVHGIWSDSSVWSDANSRFQGYLHNHGYYTASVSYLNYCGFDPLSTDPCGGKGTRDSLLSCVQGVSDDFSLVPFALDYHPRVLDTVGPWSIAAHQVAIVAHSMGGLVTRALSLESSYRAPSNYKNGWFNKVITIDTPYLGSELATKLWREWAPLPSPCSLFIAGKAGRIDEGVRQLIPDSCAIHNTLLDPSDYPAHVIAGVDRELFESDLERAMNRGLLLCASWSSVDDILCHDANDAVVRGDSQLGGLPCANPPHCGPSTLYGALIHKAGSDNDRNHAVLYQPFVKSFVVRLLDSSSESECFGQLPSLSSMPVHGMCNGMSSGCGVDNAIRSSKPSMLMTGVGIHITDPLPNASIPCGSLMNIAVSLDSGISLSTVNVSVGDLGPLTLQAPTFQGTFQIPLNAIGKKTLLATASDGTNSYQDQLDIIVTTNATLTWNDPLPKRILAPSPGAVIPVLSQGHYSDAVSRYVQDPSNGTVYSTDSGGTVASVNANGEVALVGNGVDTLHITIGSVTAQVPIQVGETTGDGVVLLSSAYATPTSGVAPLPVSFVGQASGGVAPLAYHWDFGDGFTADMASPSHTYVTNGLFSAQLTVTDAAGHATASPSISVTVTASKAGEAAAVDAPLRLSKGTGSSISAMFGSAPCASDHTAYWGTSIGPMVGYNWSSSACGLGTSGTALFDPGDPAPGAFFYFVVVGNNGTVEGSYGRDSLGKQRPEAVGIGACDIPQDMAGACDTPPCVLSCTAAAVPVSGNAPLPVSFTASAIPTNCYGTPSYSWAFGDGVTSSAQNPSHTYNSAGTYTWHLIVTIGGTQCSKSASITVTPPPDCFYQDSFERAAVGPDWSVTGTGTATIVNYPPDGHLSLASPSGTTTALLVASGTQIQDASLSFYLDNGPSGRANNITETLLRYKDPNDYYAVIIAEDDYCCDGPCGGPRTYVSIAKYIGGVETLLTTQCMSLDPGVYQFSVNGAQLRFTNTAGGTPIDLSASDSSISGCGGAGFLVNEETSLIDNVVLCDLHTDPAFTCTASASPTTGPPPLSVSFQATLTPADCRGVVSYAWDFGDGQTSSAPSPNHTYATQGTYNWSVMVTKGAVTCTKTGTVVVDCYQDFFDRSDLGVDWQVSGTGGAAIIHYPPDGQLSLSAPSGNTTALWTASGQQTNASLRFYLDNGNPSRANNVTEAFLRYTDVNNYYAVLLAEDTFCCDGPCGGPRTYVTIGKTVSGVWTPLITQCVSLEPGTYEFSISGGDLRFLNVNGGTPIDIFASDSSLMGPGFVGFAVNEETAVIDTVRVCNLDVPN